MSDTAPTAVQGPSSALIETWPAVPGRAAHRGVGVLVINFNTSAQTLRCLKSLAESAEPPGWVLVLDNASRDADFQNLAQGCTGVAGSELRLYRSEVNLGFADGTNFLVDELRSLRDCRFIVLLNNDAVAQPGMVTALVDAALAHPGAGLVGGRMHRLMQPETVDTLGIGLYASLMPADRRDTVDPYLGPTGGCMLMTRPAVERLIEASGYCFDGRFFCYCEDTDLVLRAVLLGLRPVYVDDLIALHEGQASSGAGGYNRFIAYHGLRNTMWMHWKLMPGPLLIKYGAFLAVAHLLSVCKLLLNGEIALLHSIYRDALKKWPEFKAERRRFRVFRTLPSPELDALIAPRFYRKGYLRLSLQQLWAKAAGKAP